MCHLSEHDMLPIQPGGLHSGDEELRSVGVAPGIGHGQPAGSEVLQLEVLVLELVAIDGLSASPSNINVITQRSKDESRVTRLLW